MSTISNCQFYCLSFNDEEKKKSMENRFHRLDIECKFYPGIKHTDERLKYAKTRFNLRQWSITYGHLDIIHDFYYNNNNKYAVICEDDILIHKNFKNIFEKVIIDLNILNLDILLLGYNIPYKIDYSNIISNYAVKHKINPLDSVFNYHTYPEYLSGSHMYIITKKFAKFLLDKYYNKFAGFDNNGFILDKTIIKEGNRALLYPMLAIENDKFQKDKYHKLCHKIHYNELYI
jgi:GR25 family glycosyltransferase involved in LPS biosynthesis